MADAASMLARPPESGAPFTIDGDPARDARLAAALRHVLASHEFPSFSRQMGELLSTLESPELSAQRLANVVLRDFALALKVVSTANQPQVNRTGRPIRSVTQAMLLLGVDAVRALAGGLLLFEHYHRRASGLEELVVLSLMTANHAREAAQRLGLGEPEAVHLCGLCRNLGEVLVACHFPDEYGDILRRSRVFLDAPSSPSPLAVEPASDADGAPLDVAGATGVAARLVLGFSFEELGEAMLAHWGMPPEVCRSVRASGRPGESLLQTITAFAHDLTTSVYRSGAGDDARAAGAALVHARYASRLRLSREALRRVLDAGVTATRDLAADVGLTLDALSHARHTDVVLAAPAGDAAASVTAGAASPGVVPTVPDALRARLLADAEAAFDPAAGHELHAVLLVVLEALLRGAPAERAAFCLVTPDRERLEARLVLGAEAEERLAPALRVPLARVSAPPVRALRRAGVVLLHDGTGAPSEDVRWLRSVGARRAVLLPLIVDGTTIGCLYADGRAPHLSGGAEDTATLAFLEAVRAITVRGVGARRDATVREVVAPAVELVIPRAPRSTDPLRPAATHAEAVMRAEVVLRLLRGDTPAALGEELGLPPGVLDAWRAAFLSGALAGLRGLPPAS